MKNIAFIGIGTMGKGMVENLLKNGFNVFAYNRTKLKAKAIKHKNFNIVDNPKEKGVEFLDAPLTGSKIGAETGQLVFMIGGNKEIFEKCMPLWNAMGKKTVYCGYIS